MNVFTAKKIKSVAEFAHYAICTGSSLKASKEHIRNHTKIFAGYESQWQGIDLAEVLEAFEQPMDCRRKDEFTCRLELLIETMQNIEIEAERAEAAAAAAAAAAQPTAEDIAHEAARIANRDHGIWITGAQITAKLAECPDYTAEQLAFLIVADIKAAERRQQYAAELATAQAEFEAAQLATVRALDTAVMAGAGDAENDDTESAEFLAYEASEAALTIATAALLQACGRYSIETATHAGRTVQDIAALKTLFMPAFTGQIENYHPGRRNELVAKALAMPTGATSTTTRH